MKAIYFYACLLLLLSCSSNKQTNNASKENNDKQHQVDIHIHWVEAYCGGAAPSDEMEIERLKGKPYANQTIHIKQGNSNNEVSPILFTGTTDQDGNLKASLPAGEYCLITELKSDKSVLLQKVKTQNIELDQTCFQEWIQSCDHRFKVSGNTKTSVTIYGRCSWQGFIPCLNTNQEPPPMMKPRE